jgi:alkaline phosphatase D
VTLLYCPVFQVQLKGKGCMQRFNFDRLLSNSYRRRHVLIGAGSLTGLAIASQWPKKVLAVPKFSNYPFSLGVASGEPLPDNVVLWTRLAPDPLNGGGMPPYNIPVQWQIATDEKMRNVVKSGTKIATPEFGHSVHVEVQGLIPSRWYGIIKAIALQPLTAVENRRSLLLRR